HSGKALPGGELQWRLGMKDGAEQGEGTRQVAGPISGGRPISVAEIAFKMPVSDRAMALRLEVDFQADGREFHNSWNLWSFPEITGWPSNVALLDPTGSLSGLDDLWESASKADVNKADVLLTNVLTYEVLMFLHKGGSVLLLQTGERPLPAVPGPF